MNRIKMSKVKEILRLHELGFSYREIASSVKCGKTVVGETLRRAVQAGVENSEGYTETELEELFFPEKESSEDSGLKMEYLLEELGKKNVTRYLLWMEYKNDNPEGLMYSQFCAKIREAKKANKISLHKNHIGGEECEVDWAGTTIPYFEIAEQRWAEAYLFVTVLPASSYPFAYAYGNQRMESWIDGHNKAFRYYGGTPRILIPDNTKTAVTKTDLYNPDITNTYREMARYYDIEIVPARPYKATDKGSVENAVGFVSRQIIAALRNEKFTSISEINEAIREKLKDLVERPFQKMEGCRRSAFEKIDKTSLRPLPKALYEMAYFKSSKAGFNYHVEYEGFFYSVPYEYSGRICIVRATNAVIEIFINGERVCVHKRRYKGSRYTTEYEHLPDKHKVVSEWNDERFLKEAATYGKDTVAYMEALLGSSTYSVQAYRKCMGVLREASKAPKEAVESASALALQRNLLECKHFKAILTKVVKETGQKKSVITIQHENIRGAVAFKGGVNSA